MEDEEVEVELGLEDDASFSCISCLVGETR